MSNSSGLKPKGQYGTAFKKAQVLKRVSIPMYFEKIIIPQLEPGGYYDNYPVDFNADPRACCPLHDEDTPSFRYYEDTSSFFCFGCQKGGNIINLHRYFAERMNGNSVDFDSAVEFLYDYFIVENEAANFVDVSQQTIDGASKAEKSSDTEIIRFMRFKDETEKRLRVEKGMTLAKKEQIYCLMDNLDLLVGINEINAGEASKYLKDKISEILKQ